jgi:UDP-N-acetylmuramate--alanine ligase
MFRGKVEHIHFVGIGGAGMSGIAEVLISMGYRVSGSDLSEGKQIPGLRDKGCEIQIGHDPRLVDGVDVVVRSTAIPDRNVEIQEAQRLKIPVIPRAEMLGELMRMKYGLAVAGTHGKTTTTSMLARCLDVCGMDPTVVIGGKLDHLGSNARLGQSEFMVAEADESDGSFLLLSPAITIVTNIEAEHLDHWGTLEKLLEGFAQFCNRVPFFGFAAVCLDDPNVQRLLPRIRRKIWTYGLSAQAELRATHVIQDGIDTRFTVVARGRELGDIRLNMPGKHNIQNALAAILVSLEMGGLFKDIQRALAGFSGVDRRFSVRARVSRNGGEPIVIVDDYGHHPTEIQATLNAARSVWPDRKIYAVFQPHRYSRVRDLEEEFCQSFYQADHVLVCPIYRAGEAPVEGLDRHRLSQGISDHGHHSVQAIESLEAATTHLLEHIGPGDVVITLGAGDVNQVCTALKERIHEH